MTCVCTIQLLKYKELIGISFVAMLMSENKEKQMAEIAGKEAYMSKNLIIYYSRKGENYVNGRIIEQHQATSMDRSDHN